MNSFWFLLKRWFIEMGSPPLFFNWSSKIVTWLGISALSFLLLGLYWGLILAPPDYKQGDVFRILYIHVPSAIMGESIFIFMALCGFINIIWRAKISGMLLKAAAPIGMSFVLLTLLTGSIWGKPTWGTWWVWDARLTSVAILFIIYLIIIFMNLSFENRIVREKVVAIFIIVGSVNLPIVKFSVDWWNTLHQPATISKLSKPSIDPSMMTPLIIMTFAFIMIGIAIAILRIKTEIISRKSYLS